MRKEVIGDCTLYLGDCLEVLPTLGKVDACVCDPPYGIAWDTDYTRFTGGLSVKRTKHNAIAADEAPFDPSPWLAFNRVVLFGANCFSDKLPLGSWLIWDKRFSNGTALLADGEAAWMNKGHGVYIKSVTSQGFVRPEPRQHPTQKPVDVMLWCLQMASIQEGHTVLDPFMGSGTTGVACVRTGRKFIGVEKDPKYFQIACDRIQAEYDRGALFAAIKDEQPSFLEDE